MRITIEKAKELRETLDVGIKACEAKGETEFDLTTALQAENDEVQAALQAAIDKRRGA